MHFRPTIAALAAASLLACGPQNLVEDTGGVAETDFGVSRDEAKPSGGGSTGGKKAPTAIAMKVQESASQDGTFATSFSINATYTLFFAFDLPSTKSGAHLARYEIITPGGSPYQVFEVPFAAGQAAVGAEAQADLISGGYRVWASMPVAGTFIQQGQLTGAWTAKVFLDGVQVASNTYTLNP
jgi:hypothetical protein